MLELKEHHFDGQFLKSFQNNVVVILYKADWCHFCQKIKPEYQELSNILTNQAIVAEMDADKLSNLISNNNKFLFGYKVNHYPTIVIYKNGFFVQEFVGERKASKIASEVFKYL